MWGRIKKEMVGIHAVLRVHHGSTSIDPMHRLWWRCAFSRLAPRSRLCSMLILLCHCSLFSSSFLFLSSSMCECVCICMHCQMVHLSLDRSSCSIRRSVEPSRQMKGG